MTLLILLPIITFTIFTQSLLGFYYIGINLIVRSLLAKRLKKKVIHSRYLLVCCLVTNLLFVIFIILSSITYSTFGFLFLMLCLVSLTLKNDNAVYYNVNHSGRKNKNEEKFIHLEEKFANDDEGLEKLKQINGEYYKQLKLFIVNELKIVDLATRFATSPRQIRRNLEYSLNILERP